MIWHIVRFDFSGVPAATREALEEGLRGLDAIDEVAWLRVGRELVDEHVTGLLTAFATEADLEAYRVHPRHVPVVEAIRAAGVAVTRLDVTTDDDVRELPA